MPFSSDFELIKEQFQLKETIITITAENNYYIEIAKKEIQRSRKEIEGFIQKNSFFIDTLKPYTSHEEDPEIIKKMCKSSKKLNVGPMATVAGVIAEYAVKAMISKGSKHAIVDNGGDIAIFSNKPVNIGIYTGNQSTNNFSFKISPKSEIIGVCTSSANVGPSLSFGNTDAVTVISHDVAIADAAATALGNYVNVGHDIRNGFRIIHSFDEIIGSIIIIGDKIGLWGNIPQIELADIPYELITKGRVL